MPFAGLRLLLGFFSHAIHKSAPLIYFIAGLRPIAMNIDMLLCEQAPKQQVYAHGCMA